MYMYIQVVTVANHKKMLKIPFFSPQKKKINCEDTSRKHSMLIYLIFSQYELLSCHFW